MTIFGPNTIGKWAGEFSGPKISGRAMSAPDYSELYHPNKTVAEAPQLEIKNDLYWPKAQQAARYLMQGPRSPSWTSNEKA